MVVMGALAYLVDIDQQILEDFVTKRFTRGRPNDQQIIESNHEALGLGRAEAEKSGFNLGELEDPDPPQMEQVPDKRKRGAGTRGDGGGHRRVHRIPDFARHVAADMDGEQPARAGQVRSPGDLRDRVYNQHSRSRVRRKESDDQHRRPRILADGRGPRPGVDGGDSASGGGHTEGRAFDRPADQDRAVRPAYRAVSRTRGHTASGDSPRHGGRVLLRRCLRLQLGGAATRGRSSC